MHTTRSALAFDIGGTKLAVAVIDELGTAHGLQVVPTVATEGPDAVIARLISAGERALEAAQAKVAPPQLIGIACGGPLDIARGRVQGPLHLPGWTDVAIVDVISLAFGLPAVLENDATAATLAEHLFGWGVGVPTMVYLTISTGVGGGAIIAGQLHRGAAGNGCEFGQMMVHPGGQKFGWGRPGRLEAYASGTAIAFRAQQALSSEPESALADFDPLRAEHVVAAAQAGDPLATRIWSEAVEALSITVTDLVNVFEPDLVVLGGGVTRAGDQLLEPVRRMVRTDAMPPAAAAVRVELSRLGDLVGVVGAGSVAFNRAGFAPAGAVAR